MKRIVLLIDTMNSGGAQRVVSHLTKILQNEYDTHLVLSEDTYHEYVCSGKQYSLDVPAESGGILKKLGLLLKRRKALKRFIKEHKIQCVISFLDSPNFVNLLAGVRDCRRIISIRNYSELGNQNSLLDRITDLAMKVLYKRADAVVTVSRLIEKSFHEHYGIPQEKLYTIYNPYNFEEIRELGSIPLTEEEKRFYDDSFVYINVGRVMYQKGHWHLVKAFAKVHEQHPNTKLVIVGEDLSQGKLTKLIGELGLQDSILLTGRTRNPYQYMMNADCYVLSSLFEGFPNAMVEAMACGCSIIAADCKSGPREILYEKADLNVSVDRITDADYGILVPQLEAEENWEMLDLSQGEDVLAQAMSMIASEPKTCQYYSEIAKNRGYDFGFDAAKQAFCKII